MNVRILFVNVRLVFKPKVIWFILYDSFINGRLQTTFLIQNFVQAKEINEDWNKCLEENSSVLGRCIYACNGNRNCDADCSDQFRERQLECPCEVEIIKITFELIMNLIFRKIVLVVVHVQITLVLKLLLLQMSLLLLSRKQPYRQHSMPSWLWTLRIIRPCPLLLTSMVRRIIRKFLNYLIYIGII